MQRCCSRVRKVLPIHRDSKFTCYKYLTCYSPNPHNHGLLLTEKCILALGTTPPVQRGRQSFPSLRSCAGRSAGLAFRWAADLWGRWSPGRRSARPWSWTAAGWPRSWPDPSVWSRARRWCRPWGCWEHKLQPSSPAQEHVKNLRSVNFLEGTFNI